MARSGALLTEAQWQKIAPLLPKPPKQRKGGRPWIQNRRVLEGILWILRSGARWQDLPEKFPHPSTCWRRLRDWEERGVWLNIWRTFLSELNQRQQLKWSESFLDGSFASAKKGAAESEKPSGARGRSGWYCDGQGLPLGVRLESASPSEVTLAEATLAEVRVPRRKGRPRQKPGRVIADRGYDSDPLRQRLKKRGIELIAPYRKNNQGRRYQDGRKLRRYKRRRIVERTHAWLGQFRRLLVRHEHLLSTYRAFFYLACFWITLRHCL